MASASRWNVRQWTSTTRPPCHRVRAMVAAASDDSPAHRHWRYRRGQHAAREPPFGAAAGSGSGGVTAAQIRSIWRARPALPLSARSCWERGVRAAWP